MKCPNCDHEGSVAEFGDPLRCPDCGAFYEKAVSLKIEKLERELAAAQSPERSAQVVTNPKPKKKTSWGVWLIAVLAVVGVFNVILNDPAPQKGSVEGAVVPSATERAVTPPTPSPRKTPLEQVRLEFKWHKKHGAMMVANFTVINDGPESVKDIEITCVHSGASGTRVDSNTRTIYDVVPAKSRKIFNGFDMGFIHSQAVASSCSIVSVKT